MLYLETECLNLVESEVFVDGKAVIKSFVDLFLAMNDLWGCYQILTPNYQLPQPRAIRIKKFGAKVEHSNRDLYADLRIPLKS